MDSEQMSSLQRNVNVEAGMVDNEHIIGWYCTWNYARPDHWLEKFSLVNVQDLDEGECCDICFTTGQETGQETMDWVKMNRCVHRFHKECVSKWFQQTSPIDSQAPSCPMCRQEAFDEPTIQTDDDDRIALLPPTASGEMAVYFGRWKKYQLLRGFGLGVVTAAFCIQVYSYSKLLSGVVLVSGMRLALV